MTEIKSNQYQCLCCGEDIGEVKGFRKDDIHCDTCGGYFAEPYIRSDNLKHKDSRVSHLQSAIPDNPA